MRHQVNTMQTHVDLEAYILYNRRYHYNQEPFNFPANV